MKQKRMNIYNFLLLDVVEGDIMLDNRNAALYRGERNAMKNVNLWPKGVVPYILDSSVGEYSHC